MKDFNLFQLCNTKEWPEVRKYLSSDAAKEEKKSNIMYRNDYGTCLHLACCLGAPDDIVKAMIDIGGTALVTMININDRTALHRACIKGASYRPVMARM
jgi:ankyrin repeat protein